MDSITGNSTMDSRHPTSEWIELKLLSEVQDGPMEQWRWTYFPHVVPEFLQGTPPELWRRVFEATEQVILTNLRSAQELQMLQAAANDRMKKVTRFAIPTLLIIIATAFALLGSNFIMPNIGWGVIALVTVYVGVIAWDERRALVNRNQAVSDWQQQIRHEAEELCHQQQRVFNDLFIQVSLITVTDRTLTGGGDGSECWYRPAGLRFGLLGKEKPLTVELQRLLQLYKDGALTDVEYEWAKRRLMGIEAASPAVPISVGSASSVHSASASVVSQPGIVSPISSPPASSNVELSPPAYLVSPVSPESVKISVRMDEAIQKHFVPEMEDETEGLTESSDLEIV